MQYQLFWGFAVGFLVSTLAHGFLVSDKLKRVCTIWFDKKKNDDSRRVFFGSFANIVKFIFALSLLLFMVIVLIALLRF